MQIDCCNVKVSIPAVQPTNDRRNIPLEIYFISLSLNSLYDDQIIVGTDATQIVKDKNLFFFFSV